VALGDRLRGEQELLVGMRQISILRRDERQSEDQNCTFEWLSKQLTLARVPNWCQSSALKGLKPGLSGGIFGQNGGDMLLLRVDGLRR